MIVAVFLFASRRRVEAEILEKAGRILDLRTRLSPVFDHLDRHDLFSENRDFIAWDKGLWDLYDFLMREYSGLRAGEPPRPILRRTRAATIRLDGMLRQIEIFELRAWWADVEFDPA